MAFWLLLVEDEHIVVLLMMGLGEVSFWKSVGWDSWIKQSDLIFELVLEVAMQEENNQEHPYKGGILGGEDLNTGNGNVFGNSAQLANPVA